ncbi:hypothetical protein CVT25_010262 [Psilocybe cyanescens]|uniref:Uncharacterized protein n=1 Tax=Psilocybe cyanescens TaxID=93625 RepID=A0A409XCZ5_PSICY|nr:hypothetical protein CVT25_010262 [Psilocybe cyanescens]
MMRGETRIKVPTLNRRMVAVDDWHRRSTPLSLDLGLERRKSTSERWNTNTDTSAFNCTGPPDMAISASASASGNPGSVFVLITAPDSAPLPISALATHEQQEESGDNDDVSLLEQNVEEEKHEGGIARRLRSTRVDSVPVPAPDYMQASFQVPAQVSAQMPVAPLIELAKSLTNTITRTCRGTHIITITITINASKAQSPPPESAHVAMALLSSALVSLSILDLDLDLARDGFTIDSD